MNVLWWRFVPIHHCFFSFFNFPFDKDILFRRFSRKSFWNRMEKKLYIIKFHIKYRAFCLLSKRIEITHWRLFFISVAVSKLCLSLYIRYFACAVCFMFSPIQIDNHGNGKRSASISKTIEVLKLKWDNKVPVWP